MRLLSLLYVGNPGACREAKPVMDSAFNAKPSLAETPLKFFAVEQGA
jgi:hypothetical protein